MNKLENEIQETLDSLRIYLEAHDGFAEMGEIKGNRVTIYCGGQCTDCEAAGH